MIRTLIGAIALAASAPAVAVDCWAATREQATTGFGDAVTAPRHAYLRALGGRLEDLLKADATLTALPGVRGRVHRFVGAPTTEGGPASVTVSAWLHRPEYWGPTCTLNRGADYTHLAAIHVAVNDLSELQHVTEASEGVFMRPDVTARPLGVPVYAKRAMLIAAPGVEPFVAARDPAGLVEFPPGASRLNDALTAGSGRARVILITVFVNDETSPIVAQLEDWLQALDPRPYAALLER